LNKAGFGNDLVDGKISAVSILADNRRFVQGKSFSCRQSAVAVGSKIVNV
jgi:hypothetical protein